MSGNAGVLNIELRVDDKGSVSVRQFGKEADKAGRKTTESFKRSGKSINDFNQNLSKSFNLLLKITGIAGGLMILQRIFSELVQLAGSFLKTAESFEAMEIQLETLTKGRGAETLDKLNKWALDMPVNTEKAVDSFRLMTAMGLNPAIKELQILTDVASIFGEDVLNRLALQLGQASAKGKIMAQDLNIMAEAGINARGYLSDAYGMTVEEIQNSSIDIKDVINTIFAGMEKDFGGSAKKMMGTWRGLKTVTKSYFVEIKREVMSAGIFDELKSQLAGFNAEMKIWLEANRELIQQKVPEYIEDFKEAVQVITTLGRAVVESVKQFQTMNTWLDRTIEKTGTWAKLIKTTYKSTIVIPSPGKVWGVVKETGITENLYDIVKASDLALQGLVNLNDLPVSPAGLHKWLEDFEKNPALTKLKQEAEDLEWTIDGLQKQFDKAEKWDWLIKIFEPESLSGLNNALTAKVKELETVKEQIEEQIEEQTRKANSADVSGSTKIDTKAADLEALKKQQAIAAEQKREAAEKATMKYDAFVLANMDKTTQAYKDKWIKASLEKWKEEEALTKAQMATIEAILIESVDKYEAAQKAKRLEQYNEDYEKAISDPFDYELKMIEKARQARVKDGYDTVKLAEWVSAEKQRIEKERQESEEKEYDDKLRGWAKFDQLSEKINQLKAQAKTAGVNYKISEAELKAVNIAFIQGITDDVKNTVQSQMGGVFSDALRTDLSSALEYFSNFTSSLQSIWGAAMARMMMTKSMWSVGGFAGMGVAGLALAGVGSVLNKRAEEKAERERKKQMRAQLSDQLGSEIAQLELSDVNFQIFEMNKKFKDLAKNAAYAGYPMEEIIKLRKLETEEIIKQSRAVYDGLSGEINDWVKGKQRQDWGVNDWAEEYGNLSDQLMSLDRNDASYQEESLNLLTEQWAVLQKMYEIQESQLRSLESTSQSLSSQIWGLNHSEGMPTTASEYQARYDDLLKEAREVNADGFHDTEAIAEFQSFASEYVDEMAAYGRDYNTLISTVTDDLLKLDDDIQSEMEILTAALGMNTGAVDGNTLAIIDAITGEGGLQDTIQDIADREERDAYVKAIPTPDMITRSNTGQYGFSGLKMGFQGLDWIQGVGDGSIGNLTYGALEQELVGWNDYQKLLVDWYGNAEASLDDTTKATVNQWLTWLDKMPWEMMENDYLANGGQWKTQQGWLDFMSAFKLWATESESLPDLPTFATGGLMTGPSIGGEAGHEWAVPAYNNKYNDNFLESVGIKQILAAISANQVGSGEIHVHVTVDGRELGYVIADQTRKNPELKEAMKRAVAYA